MDNGIRFIKEFLGTRSNTSRDYIEHLINEFSKYEKEYRSDISKFSKEQILSILKEKKSSSLESLRVQVSIIRQYVLFCNMQDGVHTTNSYEEIDSDALRECISTENNGRVYLSREDLLDRLFDLYNPCDQFLMLAIYEGIGAYGDLLEEVFYSKKENIKEHSILLCSGRELDVSAELIHFAKLSSEQEQYDNLQDFVNFTPINLNVSKGYIINPRNNCIDTEDRFLSYNRGIRRFARIKKYLALNKITIPRLRICGFVYYAKKIMDNNKLTYDEAFDLEEFQALTKRYGYDAMKKSRLYASIKDYL